MALATETRTWPPVDLLADQYVAEELAGMSDHERERLRGQLALAW